MGDERGDLGREVNAVDKNVNIQNLREWSALGCLVEIPLKNIIPDWVSKVDGTQCNTYSSNPIFLNRSTAPRPQRPSAPITRALTPFPSPPRLSLTAETIASSLGYGFNWSNFFPCLCEANARAPAAAPANPAWNPNAATRLLLSSSRNSKSYSVPPPRLKRDKKVDQPAWLL